MELVIAMLGFIYFYALHWDNIPKEKKRVVYLGAFMITAVALIEFIKSLAEFIIAISP